MRGFSLLGGLGRGGGGMGGGCGVCEKYRRGRGGQMFWGWRGGERERVGGVGSRDQYDVIVVIV